jgi:hypothetical protein
VTLLKDPNLRRFWFQVPSHLGIGVSAYSLAEAVVLARGAASQVDWPFEVDAVVEDIDIKDPDQNHVVPNMGLVNFHGVWYPFLNP